MLIFLQIPESKPLQPQELIAKGYEVTIISRNADKQQQIEGMGAQAAIGSMKDATRFLKI